MLNRLRTFLPPNPAFPLPEHAVSAVSVKERALGLGNRRGTEVRGVFGLLELKGLRLDAVARFELWAANPVDANAAVETLQQNLFAIDLFSEGFLRFDAKETSSAELVDTGTWRRTADYSLLFEHRFADTDGAQSLIARIPIHTDPEQSFSPDRETTVVTDEMVRWDNESAPSLVIRGSGTVGRLGVLDFQTAIPPSGQVTLTRTFDGAAGPLVVLATLEDFLDAVSDPVTPERQAEVTIGSLTAFLASFTSAGLLDLGDWDDNSVIDEYQSRVLSFGRTITDLAIGAADDTNVTSAVTPFGSIDVGNSLNITSGVDFTTGRYRIIEVDVGNVATLDRPCGITGSTNGSGKIDRPLVLQGVGDTLEVAYQDSALDEVAVLYMRSVPN